jgi:hypothetical protein
VTSTAAPAAEATGLAAEESARRRRTGLKTSPPDMALSLLVIVTLVAVIFGLVPQPNAQPIRNVDIAQVAQRAAPRLGFVPAVPRGLPAGWVATSADVRDGGDGITFWHVGYQTPDGHYASIEQGLRVTREWISIMDSGGVPRPSQVVAGTTWVQHYKDVREVTALIHEVQGRTTMITSKGGGLRNASVLAAAVPAPQR